MSITPTAIHAEPNLIQITWPDNQVQKLSAYTLRCACPCATCVSEVTGKRTLDVSRIAKDIQITKAVPTGNYALSIEFSDFHSTGIFTYELMQALSNL